MMTDTPNSVTIVLRVRRTTAKKTAHCAADSLPTARTAGGGQARQLRGVDRRERESLDLGGKRRKVVGVEQPDPHRVDVRLLDSAFQSLSDPLPLSSRHRRGAGSSVNSSCTPQEPGGWRRLRSSGRTSRRDPGRRRSRQRPPGIYPSASPGCRRCRGQVLDVHLDPDLRELGLHRNRLGCTRRVEVR